MSWEHVLVVLFAVVGYVVGRRSGIALERLRVVHAFDVALCIVSSGALHKVRRRVLNEIDDSELRLELVREAAHRQRESLR